MTDTTIVVAPSDKQICEAADWLEVVLRPDELSTTYVELFKMRVNMAYLCATYAASIAIARKKRL